MNLGNNSPVLLPQHARQIRLRLAHLIQILPQPPLARLRMAELGRAHWP